MRDFFHICHPRDVNIRCTHRRSSKPSRIQWRKWDARHWRLPRAVIGNDVDPMDGRRVPKGVCCY